MQQVFCQMFYMPFDTSHMIFGAINPVQLFLNSSGKMGQISGTYTVSNLMVFQNFGNFL